MSFSVAEGMGKTLLFQRARINRLLAASTDLVIANIQVAVLRGGRYSSSTIRACATIIGDTETVGHTLFINGTALYNNLGGTTTHANGRAHFAGE